MSLAKKTAVGLLTLCFLSTAVYARDDFLCMMQDDNVAISADENGDYKYINMVDSNGNKVYPQISQDGNTYLPLRYICEEAGLKDGSDIQGILPDGYFRYHLDMTNYDSYIEIHCGKNNIKQSIDTPFQFTTGAGEVRNGAIYNISGSLYAPMVYITMITGSEAVWDNTSGRIMFVGESAMHSKYLNEDNTILREKEVKLFYENYNNNICKTGLYLKTDGDTVANLNSELIDEEAHSINRSGNTIYFINSNNVIKTVKEGSGKSSRFDLYDGSGIKSTVPASNIVIIQNRIFGVESLNGSNYGKLFCADLDGRNFKYLTDIPVFNLIVKKIQLDNFLYYCEANNRSTIHMIHLRTMDDNKYEITNHNHENMLCDIRQFAVGDKRVFYLDSYGRIHVIKTDYVLENVGIERLNDDAHTIRLNGNDGGSIENVDFMNFDYINYILYAVKNDGVGKVYYYSNGNDSFNLLYSFSNKISDFALFSNYNYDDCFAAINNGVIELHKTLRNDGTVNMIG